MALNEGRFDYFKKNEEKSFLKITLKDWLSLIENKLKNLRTNLKFFEISVIF